ncbi:MAG TPA: hypothetical protein VF288_10650 [Mycobacteriales bacterium]
MTRDEVQEAMARVGVHWPHVTLNTAQVRAWRDCLRRFELRDALSVLDDMRAGQYQRYAPDPGAVLCELQARARRARAVISAPSAGNVASKDEAIRAIRAAREAI